MNESPLLMALKTLRAAEDDDPEALAALHVQFVALSDQMAALEREQPGTLRLKMFLDPLGDVFRVLDEEGFEAAKLRIAEAFGGPI
jgi:hypothetical protein